MSTSERMNWSREQLHAVLICEREMQIVNGTVFVALRDEWVRAWPETAAYSRSALGAIATGHGRDTGIGTPATFTPDGEGI